MHCIVKATTHNENIESRVEYAIFEITPALVARINGLQAATALVQASFEQPQALTVRDSTPMFFDPGLLDDEEEFAEFLEIEVDDGYKIIDPQQLPIPIAKLEKCAKRVDTPVLKMFGYWPDSIKWSGYIKHCGITFETELIKIDDLKAIANVPIEKLTCLSLHGPGPATVQLKQFNTEAERKAYIDGVNASAGWLESWCEHPNDEGKFSLNDELLCGLRKNHSLNELANMGITIPAEQVFD